MRHIRHTMSHISEMRRRYLKRHTPHTPIGRLVHSDELGQAMLIVLALLLILTIVPMAIFTSNLASGPTVVQQQNFHSSTSSVRAGLTTVEQEMGISVPVKATLAGKPSLTALPFLAVYNLQSNYMANGASLPDNAFNYESQDAPTSGPPQIYPTNFSCTNPFSTSLNGYYANWRVIPGTTSPACEHYTYSVDYPGYNRGNPAQSKAGPITVTVTGESGRPGNLVEHSEQITFNYTPPSTTTNTPPSPAQNVFQTNFEIANPAHSALTSYVQEFIGLIGALGGGGLAYHSYDNMIQITPPNGGAPINLSLLTLVQMACVHYSGQSWTIPDEGITFIGPAPGCPSNPFAGGYVWNGGFSSGDFYTANDTVNGPISSNDALYYCSGPSTTNTISILNVSEDLIEAFMGNWSAIIALVGTVAIWSFLAILTDGYTPQGPSISGPVTVGAGAAQTGGYSSPFRRPPGLGNFPSYLVDSIGHLWGILTGYPECTTSPSPYNTSKVKRVNTLVPLPFVNQSIPQLAASEGAGPVPAQTSTVTSLVAGAPSSQGDTWSCSYNWFTGGPVSPCWDSAGNVWNAPIPSNWSCSFTSGFWIGGYWTCIQPPSGPPPVTWTCTQQNPWSSATPPCTDSAGQTWTAPIPSSWQPVAPVCYWFCFGTSAQYQSGPVSTVNHTVTTAPPGSGGGCYYVGQTVVNLQPSHTYSYSWPGESPDSYSATYNSGVMQVWSPDSAASIPGGNPGGSPPVAPYDSTGGNGCSANGGVARIPTNGVIYVQNDASPLPSIAGGTFAASSIPDTAAGSNSNIDGTANPLGCSAFPNPPFNDLNYAYGTSQTTPIQYTLDSGAWSQTGPPSSNYGLPPGWNPCNTGDALVQGTLNGRLTIDAQNDVVVTNSIFYGGPGCPGTGSPAVPSSSCNSMLGLTAAGNVVVNHPLNEGVNNLSTILTDVSDVCAVAGLIAGILSLVGFGVPILATIAAVCSTIVYVLQMALMYLVGRNDNNCPQSSNAYNSCAAYNSSNFGYNQTAADLAAYYAGDATALQGTQSLNNTIQGTMDNLLNSVNNFFQGVINTMNSWLAPCHWYEPWNCAWDAIVYVLEGIVYVVWGIADAVVYVVWGIADVVQWILDGIVNALDPHTNFPSIYGHRTAGAGAAAVIDADIVAIGPPGAFLNSATSQPLPASVLENPNGSPLTSPLSCPAWNNNCGQFKANNSQDGMSLGTLVVNGGIAEYYGGKVTGQCGALSNLFSNVTNISFGATNPLMVNSTLPYLSCLTRSTYAKQYNYDSRLASSANLPPYLYQGESYSGMQPVTTYTPPQYKNPVVVQNGNVPVVQKVPLGKLPGFN